MPRISQVPKVKPPSELEKFFTIEMWESVFPYAKASAVFTHDSKPFWSHRKFIESVEWMNSHENPKMHGIFQYPDGSFNKYELAAFLANFQQETGEPSLTAPYPWGWPKAIPKGESHEGVCGGALAIMEGIVSQVYFEKPIFKGVAESTPQILSTTEKRVLDTADKSIGGIVQTFVQLNQPQFGLPNSGVVFQEGLAGVSDDGTLWGVDRPFSEYKKDDSRTYSSKGPYAQYGGRGSIQLSYNYNYSWCSMDLFGDYRLVRYPNLIITTDRENFNGDSYYWGFPGPNENGNNKLPENLNDTPEARILAIVTSMWFQMCAKSGRTITCHDAMDKPFEMGITSANMIINNQSGCSKSWAYDKVQFYKRICNIFKLPYEGTIICPPHPLSKL